MINPPDYVLSVKPYLPGKPVEELERELGITGSVKLASNENPLGPSPKAVEALKGCLDGLNRYPDGGGFYLKQKLASALGIQEDELILGNGSNELLDIAVRTFMKPGEEAVMASPSFVVYPMATRLNGCKAVEVPLKDWRHDLDAMADAITGNTRIIFIANPNNPTGTINTFEEFDRFMGRVPDRVLVIVDEAYYEYVTDSSYADSMKHFRVGRDLLVLRTFSKIYGLAGLRIGYGIGRRELLVEMNKVREPFNTGTLSQAAALAAIDDGEHVSRSRDVNGQGKKFLQDEFASMGLRYVPTEANFIYIDVDDSMQLYESLLKLGVIIRPMGPRALRITIGLPEENERLVSALREVLGQAMRSGGMY